MNKNTALAPAPTLSKDDYHALEKLIWRADWEHRCAVRRAENQANFEKALGMRPNR